MPFETKKLFRRWLVNSVLLSFRILWTGSLIWSSISFMKFIKTCSVSDLSLRKKTHVKQVKSSTITSMCFLWWRLATVDGLKRSICSSSRGSKIDESITNGWLPFDYFPYSQAGQRVSLLYFRIGRPRTSSSVTRFWLTKSLDELVCDAITN